MLKLSISAKKALGEGATVIAAAAATAGANTAVGYFGAHLNDFSIPLMFQPFVLAMFAAFGRYVSQKFKHPDPQ